MNALANYDAACRALAQAAAVDEVLNIRDQAEAMRAYGRQSKNRELEAYAQEIRLRAERKLGGLIIQQKETVGLAPAGRPAKSVVNDDQLNKVPTLAEMGISKDLSSRAQKLAAVPHEEFEANIVEHKQRIAAENARVVNKLEKAGAAATARQQEAIADDEDGDGESDFVAQLVEENKHLAAGVAQLKAELLERDKHIALLKHDDLAAKIDDLSEKCAKFDSLASTRFSEIKELKDKLKKQHDFVAMMKKIAGLAKDGDLIEYLKNLTRRSA